ncbi:putative membrane protein YdjX (TVP38/TMEM64 family) [Allofrancisella inopinata]|uniref:TVP38/TMEM64 family membrane protein n=1 Tax=Allofrancisella inopinata TaxID=1085647 RepID=A0AAE6YI91_9GAMM|nr:VTT domain-containing protein [Allofrancisella inopinata]QIV96248.1 DedA family protein [Allofrancisella inopinata]TDT74521.1 putative membrane protein YdjX (TVP38/TMEM64 family) [Allofrancisella inopinata]
MNSHYLTFFKRFLLLLFLVGGLVLFFLFNGSKYSSFDELVGIYKNFKSYVDLHFTKAIFMFGCIYVLTVFFSIPIKPALKILAGLFFGLWFGFIISLVSATTGGMLAFMFIKYSWGEVSKNPRYKLISKFKGIVESHPITVLFLARLLPIPFFVPNILAGILKVKNSIFFFTTLIGIIPITFIYVWIGTYVSQKLSTHDGSFLDKELIVALSILGILATVPLLIKKVVSK